MKLGTDHVKVGADLVESIIERLVEVLQVEQNNGLPCLHAHLDPVDVPTNLQNTLLYHNTLHNTNIVCKSFKHHNSQDNMEQTLET